METFFLNQWEHPASNLRNELVFENRNHEYGAYRIRNAYHTTLVKALCWASAFVALLLLIPAVISGLLEKIPPVDTGVLTDFVYTIPPPPADKPEEFTPNKSNINPPKSPRLLSSLLFALRDEKAELDTTLLDNPEIIARGSKNGATDPDASDEDWFPDLSSDGKAGQIIASPGGNNDNTIHLDISEMPEFVGGEQALYRYLSSELVFPEYPKSLGISGLVSVGFVIEKDGSVTQLKVVGCDKPGYGFEEEALRVIKAMPNWKPGKHNGKPARVQFNIPIKFRAF